MKTFRGFSLKPDVGLGLQNHFQRKNTQEPARYSKWGGFKDLDWDFLDREFYSKGGKKHTDGQNDDEELVLEEKVKLLGKAIWFSDQNHKFILYYALGWLHLILFYGLQNLLILSLN